MDVLVVGAGFAGAVCARALAEAGRRVRVLDRRPHVAGNAFDEVNCPRRSNFDRWVKFRSAATPGSIRSPGPGRPATQGPFRACESHADARLGVPKVTAAPSCNRGPRPIP